MRDFQSAGAVVGGGPIVSAMWVSTVKCWSRARDGRPPGNARESFKAMSLINTTGEMRMDIPRQ